MNEPVVSFDDFKEECVSSKKNPCLPQDFRLRFLMPGKCRYCKRLYITNVASLFDGNSVVNCTHCGGRHGKTMDELTAYRKRSLIAAVAAACACLFFLLVLLRLF